MNSLGANPSATALGVVYVAVMLLAVGEHLCLRKRIAGIGAPLVMAVGALLTGLVWTTLFTTTWHMWVSVRPEVLASALRGRYTVQVVLAFVLWDATGWLYHWVGHHTAVGWASHRPHHTGTTYDLTLGLRQSWTAFHGIPYQSAIALLGVDLRVLITGAAVSNLWQFAVHTSSRASLPAWVEAAVMTPATHRHHHALDGRPVNLGAVLTVWDRMAGTWLPSSAQVPTAYGLTSVHESDQRNAFRLELDGWTRLVVRRSRVRSSDRFRSNRGRNTLSSCIPSEHTES